MRILFTTIITASAALFFTSTAFCQADGGHVVNQFIKSQAKAARSEEYTDARKVLRGDINGDGQKDLVVLYTLEGAGGGNSYNQYLAVFLTTGRSYREVAHVLVGGKLQRDVELSSISDSTINLDTKAYAKNDPACCPSRAGKARFVLRANKLVEVK